jgi:aryl-alcohol dehydrogenase-like predicted oxidoreductase
MSDLVKSGKVLYYGVSEWSPVQLMEALGVIKDMRLRPMAVIQPQYHMFDRYLEEEIIGICERSGIGIVPFNTLAYGFLEGKLQEGSASSDEEALHALQTEENRKKVEKITEIAEKLNITLPMLAMAWVLRKSQISSLVTEAVNLDQLDLALASVGLTIPTEVLAEVESVLQYMPFFRQIA